MGGHRHSRRRAGSPKKTVDLVDHIKIVFFLEFLDKTGVNKDPLRSTKGLFFATVSQKNVLTNMLPILVNTISPETSLKNGQKC